MSVGSWGKHRAGPGQAPSPPGLVHTQHWRLLAASQDVKQKEKAFGKEELNTARVGCNR